GLCRGRRRGADARCPTRERSVPGRGWRALMTGDELVERFEAGTLPESCFGHAEHVQAAWVYLRRHPFLEASARFRAGLQEFASRLGKADRYHETITWAYLVLIHERLQRLREHPSWEQFAAANRDLLDWKSSILARYYRPETLGSPLARRIFLFPDNLPVAADPSSAGGQRGTG